MRIVFQFTRPQGARRLVPRVDVQRTVSIHAPARGATVRGITMAVIIRFNSRARKGRDMTTSPVVFLGPSFNSRARKGRD